MPARALDVAALDRAIDAIAAGQRDVIEVSVWVGGPTGRAWYARDAARAMPTASVIKTAYLVELFAAHARALDAPPPGLARLLRDGGHPALAPFRPGQRADIRRALGAATVRRIGAVMMARTRSANHVYNAAANVATALLGGPAGLTARIRRRDPAFATLAVRRYMLAARRRDNTASAAALAAVLQRLAARRVPGVDAAKGEAIRGAMRTRRAAGGGEYHAKAGYLASAPVVSALSGWWESGGRAVVYVVMTCARRRGRAADPLVATARRIRNLLLRRTQPARRSRG